MSIEVDVKQDAWDPDGNHVAFNVGGSVESRVVINIAYYINLLDGKLKELRASYVSSLGRILLYLIPDAVAGSPMWQIGSVTPDLCSVLPVAQTNGLVYYGLTGATGTVPSQTVVTLIMAYGERLRLAACCQGSEKTAATLRLVGLAVFCAAV